jgi:hypothetical protein
MGELRRNQSKAEDLYDDIKDSADNLVYILNNPDKDIIKDVEGTIDDLVFLKKKIKTVKPKSSDWSF